jgi:cell wall-associated NlpC family hydrolase
VPRKKRGAKFADHLASWDGTPFHEHANLKGVGCDCKGMLWGAADELGFPEAHSEYAQALDYSLTRRDGVSAARLREGFAALFDRVDDMQRGDILLCKWGGRPGHIAVYDGDGRAWSALPSSGVRRRSLRALTHKFPIDSVWRWR